MSSKLPNPAPNRRPDGSIDPEHRKPPASPAPPPARVVLPNAFEFATMSIQSFGFELARLHARLLLSHDEGIETR